MAPKHIDAGSSTAVAGADHQPQQMRHHDADEADDARERHRRAGGGGDQHDGRALEPLDREAAVEGFGFAQHEQIEAAHDERHRHRQQHEERRERGDLAPGRAARASRASRR